jgi:hypothetical protein
VVIRQVGGGRGGARPNAGAKPVAGFAASEGFCEVIAHLLAGLDVARLYAGAMEGAAGPTCRAYPTPLVQPFGVQMRRARRRAALVVARDRSRRRAR